MQRATLPLTVATLRTVAAVAALGLEYAELEASAANALPFTTFEWHCAWCRHFLGGAGPIEDRPLFYVMREQAGRCVAIVALVRTRRRFGGVALTSIVPLGADPGLTEIRAPLIEPGYERAAMRVLQERLQAERPWDWVEWSGPPEFFAAALAAAGPALSWLPHEPVYILDLPSTWEQFRATLKRNIRESLRHCYNSLARDGHHCSLRIPESPAAVRDALERFYALHALRAGMAKGVAHADRFASRRVRLFMHEVCGALAARGQACVFELLVDGRPVASRIGFRTGGSLYLYYSGFDPAWAAYSVMTTTVAEIIKHAIAAGLRSVNLSPGTDVSKTRWGPRKVAQQIGYQHGGRLRSRLARHAYVKGRTARGLQGWLMRRLARARRDWT